MVCNTAILELSSASFFFCRCLQSASTTDLAFAVDHQRLCESALLLISPPSSENTLCLIMMSEMGCPGAGGISLSCSGTEPHHTAVLWALWASGSHALLSCGHERSKSNSMLFRCSRGCFSVHLAPYDLICLLFFSFNMWLHPRSVGPCCFCSAHSRRPLVPSVPDLEG